MAKSKQTEQGKDVGKRKHSFTKIESPKSPANPNSDTLITPSSPSKRMKKEPDTPTKPKKGTSSPPAVESTFDVITTLSVGADNKPFHVHCGLLCQSSESFADLLGAPKTEVTKLEIPGTGCYLDYQQRTIFLPNEDADMFARVNHWLYSNELLFKGEKYANVQWPVIISIYQFATKYKFIRLQNECIDDTILKHKTDKVLPNADTMTKLWRNDTGAAPLRRLFLALYAHDCDLSSLPGNFPTAFLKGLIAELHRMKVDGFDEGFKFYKHRRNFYVSDAANPLPIDG